MGTQRDSPWSVAAHTNSSFAATGAAVNEPTRNVSLYTKGEHRVPVRAFRPTTLTTALTTTPRKSLPAER
jgi:hypothetical protein